MDKWKAELEAKKAAEQQQALMEDVKMDKPKAPKQSKKKSRVVAMQE